MKKISLLTIILSILISCKNTSTKNNTNSQRSNTDNIPVNIMWRAMQYDSILNDSLNTIVLNEAYLKKISPQEKAAIAYVATFIGNDCEWDGKANEDMSNLNCTIIKALDLGYQCSDKHLGYLQKWFSKDTKVLSEIEKSNCPTIPFTASIQESFDNISISTKRDSISIYYDVSGVNSRENQQWERSEIAYFIASKDKVKLIKKETSKVD